MVRVTEEDAEDMEVLKSTLLSEQSQKTYCAFLVKFVFFCGGKKTGITDERFAREIGCSREKRLEKMCKEIHHDQAENGV